jgi:hypothetical protein
MIIKPIAEYDIRMSQEEFRSIKLLISNYLKAEQKSGDSPFRSEAADREIMVPCLSLDARQTLTRILSALNDSDQAPPF